MSSCSYKRTYAPSSTKNWDSIGDTWMPSICIIYGFHWSRRYRKSPNLVIFHFLCFSKIFKELQTWIYFTLGDPRQLENQRYIIFCWFIVNFDWPVKYIKEKRNGDKEAVTIENNSNSFVLRENLCLKNSTNLSRVINYPVYCPLILHKYTCVILV